MNLPKAKNKTANFLGLPFFESWLRFFAVNTETSILDIGCFLYMLFDCADSLELLDNKLYFSLCHFDFFSNLWEVFWRLWWCHFRFQSQCVRVFVANQLLCMHGLGLLRTRACLTILFKILGLNLIEVLDLYKIKIIILRMLFRRILKWILLLIFVLWVSIWLSEIFWILDRTILKMSLIIRNKNRLLKSLIMNEILVTLFLYFKAWIFWDLILTFIRIDFNLIFQTLFNLIFK